MINYEVLESQNYDGTESFIQTIVDGESFEIFDSSLTGQITWCLDSDGCYDNEAYYPSDVVSLPCDTNLYGVHRSDLDIS